VVLGFPERVRDYFIILQKEKKTSALFIMYFSGTFFGTPCTFEIGAILNIPTRD
jgi:purine-cytosine permease-like protein